jgi:hypothetical protein
MIPFPPTNLVLSTGNGQNFLTWQQVAGATSYTVQRSTTGIVGSYSTVASPAANTFLDVAATVGTQYWYQVASTNSSGTSTYSSVGTNGQPLTITPCLPGQINLGYLRYMSRLQADQLNSQFLTDDEWNFNINQSVAELYDILVTKFGDDYFFAPPLIIPLTGANAYDLPNGGNYQLPNLSFPPALYKLNGIDVNINGVTATPNAIWVPVARFNWSDRDRYQFFGINGLYNAAFQLAYRPMGSQIQIIPANSAQVIRMWYVPIVQQLLQDTDMLPFSVSGWSEYVIVDAAMKAMLKQESFEQAQAKAGQKAALKERIETTAANRDAGNSNTVSNVRATSSDPAFSNGLGYGNSGYGGFGGGFW